MSDEMIRVIYLRTEGKYMLCMLTNGIAFDTMKRTAILARMMGLLEDRYPGDEAIRGWRELLEENLAELQAADPENNGAGSTEFFAEFLRRGAGGLRLLGVVFICRQHFIDVDVFIIHVFLAADADGEGNGGKIEDAFAALNRVEITAGITDQVPHEQSPPYAAYFTCF